MNWRQLKPWHCFFSTTNIYTWLRKPLQIRNTNNYTSYFYQCPVVGVYCSRDVLMGIRCSHGKCIFITANHFTHSLYHDCSITWMIAPAVRVTCEIYRKPFTIYNTKKSTNISNEFGMTEFEMYPPHSLSIYRRYASIRVLLHLCMPRSACRNCKILIWNRNFIICSVHMYYLPTKHVH